MTTVPPEIPCTDYWPHGIPKTKLAAYQAMLTAGQITKPHVIVNKSTGSMIVSYASTVPQEWIRQEMGRLAGEPRQLPIET